MSAARLAAPAPVDQAALAALSASAAALAAVPAALRDLRAEVEELRDRLVRSESTPEQADAVGRAWALLEVIDAAVARTEAEAEPERSALRSAVERLMEGLSLDGREGTALSA